MGLGSAVLLVALLLLFRGTTGNKLAILTLINVAVVLFQVILAFKISGVAFRITFKSELAGLSRSIIRVTGPLTVSMLIGLIPFVVDKWLMARYFSLAVFTDYTLNFQFALAVTSVANVVNIYNSPRVCELYNLGDVAGIKANLKTNYSLACAGSLAIGLSMFIYAWLTNVPLGAGYWVLVVAFALCNLFAINTTFLIAERRTTLLGMIGGVAALGFLSVMTFGIVWRAPEWTYLAQLLFQTSVVLGSFWAIRASWGSSRLAAAPMLAAPAGISGRANVGDGLIVVDTPRSSRKVD